jgi:aromatic ring-cleaving dioxygenase
MLATATVTVVVEDINDNAPVFTQKIFRAVMSENSAVGASVITVSATDADVGPNARLMYSLKKQDREYFTIVTVEATNSGVLKVHKVNLLNNLVC